VGILTVGWRIGYHLGVSFWKNSKARTRLERFMKRSSKPRGYLSIESAEVQEVDFEKGAGQMQIAGCAVLRLYQLAL
jgi:hypothetical protein